jgi:hypothetical protein
MPKKAAPPALPQPRTRTRIRAARPARLLPDRRTALARLLPLWPHELEDESPTGRRYLLARLRRALRAERCRGIAGHWTYDLARHVELLRVYRAELAALRTCLGTAPKPAPADHATPL